MKSKQKKNNDSEDETPNPAGDDDPDPNLESDLEPEPEPNHADVNLTISSTVLATSALENGWSIIDNSLVSGGANQTGKARARQHINAATSIANVHMQGFGSGKVLYWDGNGSPPTTPNYNAFKTMLDNILPEYMSNVEGVFTFYGIPSWMRGATTASSPVNTTLSAAAAAGATQVTVNNATGFVVGRPIKIVLNGGIDWFARITAINAKDITLSRPIPAGYSANAGNSCGTVTQTTNLLGTENDFGGSQDSGRLLTDRVAEWQDLVQKAAVYVMSPPYNVRIFQTSGNECKGFYNRTRDNKGQEWDWDDYPGTPGHADMGLTAWTLITNHAVIAAAEQLNIPLSSIKFGGPYPVFASKGNKTVADNVPAGHALYNKEWGTANEQPDETIDHFLRLMADHQSAGNPDAKLDFVSWDMSTYQQDGITLTDDFTVSYQKYVDYINRVKVIKAARGFSSLPLSISEWYSKPQSLMPAGNFVYRAALKALTYMAMVENGIWLSLMWGPFGHADNPNSGADSNQWEGGLVSRVQDNDGGQRQAHADVAEIIKSHFGAGVPIYQISNNKPGLVQAMANQTHVLLVSKSADTLSVSIDGSLVQLGAYETKLVQR